MTYREPARTTTRRILRILVSGLLVVIAAIAAALGYRSLSPSSSTAASPIVVLRGEHRVVLVEALPSMVWPSYGQAAVQIGQSQIHSGPNQHVAAIASVAKVMTAYLVLRDHPLRLGQDGPTITLAEATVADTDRRRRQQESVVSIAAGEQVTERQAPCTTPTPCSGITVLSASRPARTTRLAAASPSAPSAGSTASGRRSPGSCWASPAKTRSRRVSRPPTPWSTASPVTHGAKYRLRQI